MTAYDQTTMARDIETRVRRDMQMTTASYGADVDSEVLEALVNDAMHQIEQLLTARPTYCPYDCDSCHAECYLGEDPCPDHQP